MFAMKVERTERLALTDAEHACARSIAGSAFVGRDDEHADTKSAYACCNSSMERCRGARLSRIARETESSSARPRDFWPSLMRGYPLAIMETRAESVNTLSLRAFHERHCAFAPRRFVPTAQPRAL